MVTNMLKMWVTSWVLNNAHDCQFITHFWHKKFAHITYNLVFIICNDICLCEENDDVNVISVIDSWTTHCSSCSWLSACSTMLVTPCLKAVITLNYVLIGWSRCILITTLHTTVWYKFPKSAMSFTSTFCSRTISM